MQSIHCFKLCSKSALLPRENYYQHWFWLAFRWIVNLFDNPFKPGTWDFVYYIYEEILLRQVSLINEMFYLHILILKCEIENL